MVNNPDTVWSGSPHSPQRKYVYFIQVGNFGEGVGILLKGHLFEINGTFQQLLISMGFKILRKSPFNGMHFETLMSKDALNCHLSIAQPPRCKI